MSLPVALDILQELEALAGQVGEEILRFSMSDIQAMRKKDGSPVTQADQLAESMILDKLRTLTPDIPIIAEEEYALQKDKKLVDVSGGQFWLVDALDGTREFVSGGKDYTVNIGLVTDFTPVMGVIHWPAKGIAYSGLAREQIANKIYPDGQRELLRAAIPGQGLRVVSSKSFGNSNQLARYLLGREVREHRYRASSIKFCEVAEGRSDLYPRFGPSCEWDIAAGHAILVAAGGSVTTPTGQSLVYGKPDFLNSDFIATGRAASPKLSTDPSAYGK